MVGAMGAALCAMVARITEGSKRYAAVHAEAGTLVRDADILRERFMAAGPLDEEAYGRVVAAMAMPKATEDEKPARTAALQAALVSAAEAPLQVAGLAAEGFTLAARGAALGNTNLMSDVECALHFFRAALAASVANVRINHRFIKDPSAVEEQNERLVAIHDAAEREEQRVLAAIAAEPAR
jgi:formiminotetrahydrofolate cyclodeaminase